MQFECLAAKTSAEFAEAVGWLFNWDTLRAPVRYIYIHIYDHSEVFAAWLSRLFRWLGLHWVLEALLQSIMPEAQLHSECAVLRAEASRVQGAEGLQEPGSPHLHFLAV